MLDSSTLEQLRSVFSILERPIVLRFSRSSHAEQGELLEMLQELTPAQIVIAMGDGAKVALAAFEDRLLAPVTCGDR